MTNGEAVRFEGACSVLIIITEGCSLTVYHNIQMILFIVAKHFFVSRAEMEFFQMAYSPPFSD